MITIELLLRDGNKKGFTIKEFDDLHIDSAKEGLLVYIVDVYGNTYTNVVKGVTYK